MSTTMDTPSGGPPESDNRDRKTFRSKVVLSGLPPSLTEEHCRQLLTPFLPHLRSFLFVPGNPPTVRCASVIVSFTTPDRLLDFVTQWHNKTGKEGERRFVTTVRFAPVQKMYRYDSTKRRPGQRANLENWDLFKQFVEELTESQNPEGGNPLVDSFLSSERQSAALREAEQKSRPWQYDPNYVQTTPLLEHMKANGDKKPKVSAKKQKKKNTAESPTFPVAQSPTEGQQGEPAKKTKKKNKKKNKNAVVENKITTNGNKIITDGVEYIIENDTQRPTLQQPATIKTDKPPKKTIVVKRAPTAIATANDPNTQTDGDEQLPTGFYIDTTPSDQSIYSLPITAKKPPAFSAIRKHQPGDGDLKIYETAPDLKPLKPLKPREQAKPKYTRPEQPKQKYTLSNTTNTGATTTANNQNANNTNNAKPKIKLASRPQNQPAEKQSGPLLLRLEPAVSATTTTTTTTTTTSATTKGTATTAPPKSFTTKGLRKQSP